MYETGEFDIPQEACPYCKSDNISNEGPPNDFNMLEVDCFDCGRKWTEPSEIINKMKKYRVRYNNLVTYMVDVVAKSPEEAKELIRNIGNNKKYKPEITYSDGECFDFLTEINENGDDVEGSEWYYGKIK
jgi:hypothetical protein